MNKPTPHIWVLLGARAGDNAQALELARLLGGQVERKQLSFNRWSGLPNILLGDGFKTLAQDAKLAPPWPDIVIAAGRRTAPVNLGIKDASAGRTLSVQLGRPRMALERFDLVLSTPQYGLPLGPTVVPLVFPFAQAKAVPAEVLAAFEKTWSGLPKPWVAGVIGAGKFPLRFGSAELDDFAAGLNALVTRLGGSAILMDSPRSDAGAIQRVATLMKVPYWVWTRGSGDNPYQAALALSDRFAVTSDSVSMVSEMVQTGKPVYVHHLPVSGLVPRWSVESGLLSVLARKGVLSPPRNVQAFLETLSKMGWIGDLARGVDPPKAFRASNEHSNAVARIIALSKQRATG